MKILYLPINIASMPSLTADTMNKLPGVKAFSYTIGPRNPYLSPGKSTIEIELVSKEQVFKYLKNKIKQYYYLFRLVTWADVIHYTFESPFRNDLDLKIIKRFKKPGIIEWVGSEIRNPEKAISVNPYIEKAYKEGYEYGYYETDEKSAIAQDKFRELGFEPALCPEMQVYLDKDKFPIHHTLYQRINLCDFKVSYPGIDQRKPVVVHSPSAMIAKGSNIIIPFVEELKKTYDFEFILLHGMPREEVLKVVQRADIFLDQIVVGGYGMAAMEAMSYGKPVMCYIMPEVFKQGLPAECPIVNTRPDNLKEQLTRLITSGELRNELGKKSRAFVEKYHDVNKIAPQLLEIYKEVINRSKKQKNIVAG